MFRPKAKYKMWPVDLDKLFLSPRPRYYYTRLPLHDVLQYFCSDSKKYPSLDIVQVNF